MKLNPCARLATGVLFAVTMLALGVPLAMAQRQASEVRLPGSPASMFAARQPTYSKPPGGWRHGRVVVTRVRVQAAALELRLAGSPGSLFVGQQVTYSGTVANDGGPVASAAFEDRLPGRVSVVSASASQGSCTTGPEVVCDLGGLAAGASATVTITATANAPGLLVDRGWVSANPPGQWADEAVTVTDVRRLPPPHVPGPATPTVTTGAATTTGVTTVGTTPTRGATTTGATTTGATTTDATTTDATTTSTTGTIPRSGSTTTPG